MVGSAPFNRHRHRDRHNQDSQNGRHFRSAPNTLAEPLTTALSVATSRETSITNSADSGSNAERFERIGPVLKYRGSKWRLAPWILQHFPSPASYTTYIEPYFGSGAVFFTMPPSKHEILNDISGEVVNLFRVIR